MPSSHSDAMRLQAENLEQAAQSRVASRINSRIHSRVTSRITSRASSLIASAIQSRRASRPLSTRGSTSASRRGSIGPGFLNASSSRASESSPETLENLIRVTQNQESIFQTYYTNNDGELVTLSLYDISTTDPADILGNDIIAQHDHDEEFENFNEAVCEKLKRHHRSRSLQMSGDSFNSDFHHNS